MIRRWCNTSHYDHNFTLKPSLNLSPSRIHTCIPICFSPTTHINTCSFSLTLSFSQISLSLSFIVILSHGQSTFLLSLLFNEHTQMHKDAISKQAYYGKEVSTLDIEYVYFKRPCAILLFTNDTTGGNPQCICTRKQLECCIVHTALLQLPSSNLAVLTVC